MDGLPGAFDFTVPPVSPRAVLPVDAGPRAPAPLARTGEDRHPLASPPLRTAAPPLAPVVQRAAPPADEVVDPYETRLDGELAKLRQAITALDRAFRGSSGPATSQTPAEPSFADLVSDTVMARGR